MKYPKLTEEQDKRKKLTVRKMILDLINYGFSYRELAKIFGVSRSLFAKYKTPLKLANKKRYKYKQNTGNTKKYRKRIREIHGEKLLKYERYWHKKINDKNRKNKFTPRLLNNK